MNEIAKTILEQLGGGMFRAMTGAKDFMASEKGLRFSLPRSYNGIKAVSVELRQDDTYDLRFMKPDFSERTSYEGVYAEDLRKIFTEETGLYTSL